MAGDTTVTEPTVTDVAIGPSNTIAALNNLVIETLSSTRVTLASIQALQVAAVGQGIRDIQGGVSGSQVAAKAAQTTPPVTARSAGDVNTGVQGDASTD